MKNVRLSFLIPTTPVEQTDVSSAPKPSYKIYVCSF